jgi:hypothetical protein
MTRGPTPARHNGGSNPKTCVFPANKATPCQFSIWRAGGVGAKKRLFPRLFSTARHFELWRAATRSEYRYRNPCSAAGNWPPRTSSQ